MIASQSSRGRKATRRSSGRAAEAMSRTRPPRQDDETDGQVVIAGMGELHLEIIVDRLRRVWVRGERRQGRGSLQERSPPPTARCGMRSRPVARTFAEVRSGCYREQATAHLRKKDQGGTNPEEYIKPVDEASRKRSRRMSRRQRRDVRIELYTAKPTKWFAEWVQDAGSMGSRFFFFLFFFLAKKGQAGR